MGTEMLYMKFKIYFTYIFHFETRTVFSVLCFKQCFVLLVKNYFLGSVTAVCQYKRQQYFQKIQDICEYVHN
jgi:hypothetical protein